jgi:uncharacterized protein YcfJ
MKSMNKKLIGAGIGIIVLVASTAFASTYYTKASQPIAVSHAPSKPHLQKIASAQPAQPRCNDGNVLGYVAGGAVGGIAGNQVGKGSGNTAATIAGTLGGAYLGGQYIPLNNVTCRQ